MRKVVCSGVLLLALATAVPAAYPQGAEFVKTPADAAVIASGWADSPIFMTDPAVYTDEEGLHLFYTAIFCEKGGNPYYAWNPADPMGCVLKSAGGAVGYAFSDDLGLTWTIRETPLVMPGPEEWDLEKIETPFVTRVGDTLYLFYCATGSRNGQPFALRYQIGAATLDLGSRSVKQAMLEDGAMMVKRPGPLVAYNLDEPAPDNNAQEPSAVFKDGVFELYFVGLGLSLPDQGIDTSAQQITSINFMRATFDPDLNPLEPPQQIDTERMVNITEVHYVDDLYYVFYTTAGPADEDEFHHGEIIGYATSQDGLTWDDAGIVIRPGPDESFDNWGVMAPTVSFQDDLTILFYSGWEMRDHPAFPVAPDGRFGMPISQDRTIHGNVGRAVSVTLR